MAVTGCVGLEDVEITIKSSLHQTSPFGYVWDRDGSTREGDNTQVSQNTLRSFVLKIVLKIGNLKVKFVTEVAT